MKFEDVLNNLDIGEFSKMTNEELAEVIQKLRKIRMDVPETKQRRRKNRSKTHLATQLLNIAKDMMKADPETYKDMKEIDVVKMLMENDEIVALLQSQPEPAEDVEEGDNDDAA